MDIFGLVAAVALIGILAVVLLRSDSSRPQVKQLTKENRDLRKLVDDIYDLSLPDRGGDLVADNIVAKIEGFRTLHSENER